MKKILAKKLPRNQKLTLSNRCDLLELLNKLKSLVLKKMCYIQLRVRVTIRQMLFCYSNLMDGYTHYVYLVSVGDPKAISKRTAWCFLKRSHSTQRLDIYVEIHTSMTFHMSHLWLHGVILISENIVYNNIGTTNIHNMQYIYIIQAIYS